MSRAIGLSASTASRFTIFPLIQTALPRVDRRVTDLIALMTTTAPTQHERLSSARLVSGDAILLGKLWDGGAGPAIACIFTNPADVAKTRLNMERELQSLPMSPSTGSIECMRRIRAAEGLAGLQRGLYFAMVREASKNTFKIGLYQPLVDAMHDGASGPAPLSILMGAGTISGAISALICNPLDLVKTRLQLDGSHARGTAGGAPELWRGIVREEGLKGLWRGTGVSMVRSATGAAAMLPTNGRLKEFAKQWLPAGVITDAFSSLGAGAVTVAL